MNTYPYEMENLIFGGKAHNSQTFNDLVDFRPTAYYGTINVNGDIGNAGGTQTGGAQATGFSFKMSPGGGFLGLQDLRSMEEVNALLASRYADAVALEQAITANAMGQLQGALLI